MQVYVKKWGNSQRIIIPKEILKEAGISLGDSLDIKASKGSITVTKQFRHKTLEERIEDHDGEFQN